MEGVMKQNSVSSSYGVENSERVKEKILVLALASGADCPRSVCGCADFHLVNLKTDKLHDYHAPSLLLNHVPSSMVAVDDFIYVLAGASPLREYEYESEELNSIQSLYHKKVFFGGARLQLSFDQPWYPAPIPTEGRTYLRCFSLIDKIYVFGDVNLAPQVLDPAVGHYKQLLPPSHLVGCKISGYALPDPSNCRILLHLSGVQLPSPTIYAFRPQDNLSGGDWDPILVNAHHWTSVAAVVDSVIYFHSHKFPSVLRAFDLATEAWLDVHWESSFDDGLDMNHIRMHFDTMFPLGNNILCLAVWTPIIDNFPTQAKIVFRKFRVEQSGATVKLLPLPSHSFVLPATSEVLAFLPF